jgi:hypothetical protein
MTETLLGGCRLKVAGEFKIRGFIGTERLLSFWQKDSRVFSDIPAHRT